jgi:hypothetical protein
MYRKFRSFGAIAFAAITAVACGELTGPESPTTPSDVIATLATATSVNLSWTPSPLNDGVVNYSIYRNGEKVGETTGTESTYTDTGLSPQTTYVYSVAANCVGGIVSDRSVETEASTVTTVDITPPAISQLIPVPGTTQVSPAANINVIFSEPMNPSTINATTFTLRVTDGAAIAGAVTYNAETRRATLTPNAPLPNFTNLTARITTGARDLAGNALQRDSSWTFTTRDDVPPTIASTTPANGAIGVPPTSAITITFSEAMDATTINAANITLRTTTGGTAVASTVTYNATTRTATLTPGGALASGTNYTVSVSAAVKDAQGNAIVPTTFSFTVGDITAPTVTAVVPAADATGVALNTTVSATFSEPMDPTTINTTTFTLRPTAGGANITGTVAYNAATNTATFTPSATLANGTSYTATVTTGARDTAGNPLGAARTWAFTTIDTVAPTVSSVVPAAGATAIPVNTTVQVTFSEPMDVTTITNVNILLRNVGTNALVPATVTYNGTTRVATLTPTGPLSNSTQYRVEVTTGVKDASGNALAAQFNSLFTTAAAPDTTAPTIVSRAPTNGATSQAINTNVTVTFSEPMDAATITATTITLTTTTGAVSVPATVTYNAATNTATLDPTADLANNTSYTITVTSGVKDVAGNIVVGTAGQPLTSTFTTIPDTTAPTVSTTTPVTGATGIARSANILIVFSEAMNPATINGTTITMSGGVVGSVTYDAATRTATFNPSSDLAASTSYTVTILGGALGVKDLAGNAMAVNATVSFTTGT